MRTHLFLLSVVGALILAGCAQSGAPADPSTAFSERAATVADAWQTTVTQTHQQAWATEIIALQSMTVPPAGKLGDDVRYAFDSGWYRTRATLPTQSPDPAEITLPDGKTVTAALVSAAAAFTALDRGDPPCPQGAATTAPAPTGTDPGAPAGGPAQHSCTSLTVNDVKLGAAKLRTNRGVLDVPAWQFHVDEATSPITRVAVAPATFGSLPQSGISSWDQASVSAVMRLHSVTSGSVEFVIGIGACSKDPAGLVYETGQAVVLGGWARQEATGPCIGSLALVPVTVTLTQPLGARVILDAVSGQPVV